MCKCAESACDAPANLKVVGVLKNNRHVHLQRWFSHVESLESTQLALASLIGASSCFLLILLKH